jgi:ubiquinone/menaquinone biosynthesis C-methylase UbiE
LEQAVRDTTAFLAEAAEVRPGDRVVTIGCGRGGVDRFLAGERGALVTGIDISEQQLRTALDKAREAHLEDNIGYMQGTMTDLPIAKDSSDVVWAQESFFYCTDKNKAVSEFERVLRHGGKVVLEDTTLENLAARDEVYEKFCRRAIAEPLLTLEEYRSLFARHGLNLTFEQNWSTHLAETYRAIIDKIHRNREEIRKATADVFPTSNRSLEKDFYYPESLQLVEQGKMGCRVMIFQK